VRIVRTVDDMRAAVRAARAEGKRVGLVPTMGALHDGHLSLMRRARERCEWTAMSLFVNPTQFNDPKDLDRYPRDEARDAALVTSVGVDAVFAPSVEEVYPRGSATTVEVAGLSEVLEGAVRGARHFRGVTTVVVKLLNMVQPDVAFFGQKDAQQALIIRRMVADLNFPVHIEVCPTVRETDGLAMSSRNGLLDNDARRRAVALSRALFAVRDAIDAGERNTDRALEKGRAILEQMVIVPEYFAVVDAETLAPLAEASGEMLVPIAARIGDVRLIDNIAVSAAGAAR
jgi:pantoate--beta-alanine ligase